MYRLYLSLCLGFLLCASVACSGSGLNTIDDATAPERAADKWDPFAESIEVVALDSALETLRPAQSGARTVYALDANNKIDAAATAALEVSEDTGSLSISLREPLAAVSLYIEVDPASEHLAGSTFADGPLGMALAAARGPRSPSASPRSARRCCRPAPRWRPSASAADRQWTYAAFPSSARTAAPRCAT